MIRFTAVVVVKQQKHVEVTERLRRFIGNDYVLIYGIMPCHKA